MHERPQHGWTVASLAREAAMSRAAFARRFHALLGEGPLGYLTTWRMRLAAQLLRTTTLSVAEVAARVGYESEFSFSRAFRRAWAAAPSHYRGKQGSGARGGGPVDQRHQRRDQRVELERLG
jgi:AraC family transcriptional activator of mtrCDE